MHVGEKTADIDCICCHGPFITIRRFTQSRRFALYGEFGNGKCVSKEGCAADIDICIVFSKSSRVADVRAFSRVADLLYDVVN